MAADTNDHAVPDAGASDPSSARLSYDSRSEQATARLAVAVWQAVMLPDVITLEGELGSGKTVFARVLIRAALRAGGAADASVEIPSPTFTLVQTYAGTRAGEAAEIWHVDLYRITDPAELRELGLEEAFGHAIILIEWPDRLGPDLPRDRLAIRFAYGPPDGDDDVRTIELTGHGGWARRLQDVAARLSQDTGTTSDE